MTWCQSKGNIPYFETSAKEAINVEQAFQAACKNALAMESEGDMQVPPSSSNSDSRRYSDYPDPIKINASDQDTQYGCSC